jgi:hypothetical protein
VLGSFNKELLKARGGDATGYNVKSINKQAPKITKLVQCAGDGFGDQSMMYMIQTLYLPKLTLTPVFLFLIITTVLSPVK